MKHTATLLVFIAACTLFLILSFQPRFRFADPAPIAPGPKFHCYHRIIYSGEASSDILFFGASRTFRAVNADKISARLSRASREELSLQRFHTGWSNSEIVYFMLRDYLTNNPKPRILMVELTPDRPKPPPVRYVHPMLPSLAPFDLYTDVLKPNEYVRSWLFNLSDFSRLMFQHLELSLNNLLVGDSFFLVPTEVECGNDSASAMTVANDSVEDLQTEMEFQAGIRREYRRLLREVGEANVGERQSLMKHYADNKPVTRFAKRIGEAWLDRRFRFGFEKHAGQRALDYQKRIVDLATTYDVDLVFYWLPTLFEPRLPAAKQLDMAEYLGAPLIALPYPMTRVSYHFYRDPKHVAKEAQDLYAAWFAHEISRRLGN